MNMHLLRTLKRRYKELDTLQQRLLLDQPTNEDKQRTLGAVTKAKEQLEYAICTYRRS